MPAAGGFKHAWVSEGTGLDDVGSSVGTDSAVSTLLGSFRTEAIWFL
jgi:hypothetical protein